MSIGSACMARAFRGALTALGLALAALGARAGQEPEPRPADEVLVEIVEKRDLAAPELFEELGRRRDADAFRALKRARLAVQSPESIQAVYAAFRHFLGAGELEERAMEYLAEQGREGVAYSQRAATRVLASFGGRAHELLAEIVRQHADDECRRIAIGGIVPLLHAQRTPEALELLLGWYRPPTSGSRELGVRTLAVFRDDASMDAFERALDDRDVSGTTKAMVMEALATVGGERAIEIALDGLRSRYAEVQLGAIRALLALGWREDPRRFALLERAKDPAVRHAAFLARAELLAGGEEWPEELLRAARSRDWALRIAAADSLADLGDDRALAALLELAGDADPMVRRSAVRALGELRRAESVPFLVERMPGESMRLRDEIRSVLVILTGRDLGANPDRWTRWWEAEGDSFELPPRDAALAAATERERERQDGRTQSSFYGIPIHSDRITFVLDVSGSMSGLAYSGCMRIDSVREELIQALESLPDGARFNLIFFDDRVYRWRRELVEMNEETRATATQHARKQGPGGGTALYDALVEALEDPEVDTVLLLSDGEPTEGRIVDPERILDDVLQRNVLREVVIHTVSVSWTSDLLRALARETGGRYIESL